MVSIKLFAATLCVIIGSGCGSDSDGADTTVADTTVADTTPPDSADTGDSTPPDSADTMPPDSADTTVPETTDTGDTSVLPPYLENCDSLFAARVLEKQTAADPTFTGDCDTPLRDPIGLLRQGGKPLCPAGASANACRRRLYATPPALADLGQGCAADADAPSCLRGKWLPRCADGGDACAEPEAICQDGTRPLVYAEAATAGPSGVWLFHLGGEGGPCIGPKCWYNYRYSNLVEGSNEFQAAMSTTHPDYLTNAAMAGHGVSNGTVVENNPFARINRVRFERCTDAASTAEEIVPIADGVPEALAAELPDLPIATRASTVPIWHHGFATWLAAFHSMTTPAGRDLDGDGDPDMPSLADASMVLVSAASDASEWTVFAADRLAEELRAIAGADLDVRIMIDGLFGPSLDSEGRFHPDAPEDFDLFHDRYGVAGLCRLPDNGDDVDNEACSDASYRPDGGSGMALDRRGVTRDASCLAMHGAGAPECNDRFHTLVNHVATPFLVLADQEDNTVSQNPPIFADDSSYRWDEPATYRERVLAQGHDIVALWGTSAREEGPGAEGDAVVILPKARREGEPWGRATHVRFHSDPDMLAGMTLCTAQGVEVRTVPFGLMIGAWIAGELPQYHAIEDGAAWDGQTPYWVTGGSCRAPE